MKFCSGCHTEIEWSSNWKVGGSAFLGTPGRIPAKKHMRNDSGGQWNSGYSGRQSYGGYGYGASQNQESGMYGTGVELMEHLLMATEIMSSLLDQGALKYRVLTSRWKQAGQQLSKEQWCICSSMQSQWSPTFSRLEIKQSQEGTQEVPGLVEAHVYGSDEVWELIKFEGQARAVGSTSANDLTSRSH